MSWLKKYQKFLLITITSIIVLGLVLSLIIYGSISNLYNYSYPQTICYYSGYNIINKPCSLSNEKFTGVLFYKFYVSKNVIYRNIENYCGHTNQEVINYFRGNYDNYTSWPCWFQASNPETGWIGFSEPYDVGEFMIIAGVIILVSYIIMIGIYLYIYKKKYI
jgi:hypothetical protein